MTTRETQEKQRRSRTDTREAEETTQMRSRGTTREAQEKQRSST